MRLANFFFEETTTDFEILRNKKLFPSFKQNQTCYNKHLFHEHWIFLPTLEQSYFYLPTFKYFGKMSPLIFFYGTWDASIVEMPNNIVMLWHFHLLIKKLELQRQKYLTRRGHSYGTHDTIELGWIPNSQGGKQNCRGIIYPPQQKKKKKKIQNNKAAESPCTYEKYQMETSFKQPCQNLNAWLENIIQYRRREIKCWILNHNYIKACLTGTLLSSLIVQA